MFLVGKFIFTPTAGTDTDAVVKAKDFFFSMQGISKILNVAVY